MRDRHRVIDLAQDQHRFRRQDGVRLADDPRQYALRRPRSRRGCADGTTTPGVGLRLDIQAIVIGDDVGALDTRHL